jgi:hypothetical protein
MMNTLNRFKSAAYSSLLAASVFGLALLGRPVAALADLMIMPIQAVFHDHDRITNITVVNTGTEDAVFKIDWRYQIQKEDGSYTFVENAKDMPYDASAMLLFSPRQVTLPAGGKQRIRISLRRPPDLPDGEYRAHLHLLEMASNKPMPDPSTPLLPEHAQAEVKMNVAFSLPVIVRKGAYDCVVTMSDPKLVPPSMDGGPPHMDVWLNRKGIDGAITAVNVYWTPPGQQEKLVGTLNNVSLYREISKRVAHVNLTENRIVGGKIRVTVEGMGPDKGTTYDEKSFPIGG